MMLNSLHSLKEGNTKVLISILLLIFTINSNAQKISEPTGEIVEKFYNAIFTDNTALVLKMLETEFPGDYTPKNKVTPLQAAIWQNNITIVKKLVEKNAAISSDGNRNSAVEEAAEYGAYDILVYLIEKGGDIDNRAFGLAKDYRCTKYLLEQGANLYKGGIQKKLDFYLEAVTRKDTNSIKLLSLKDDELDYYNCSGETALIIALKMNDVQLVRFLIQLGVDIKKPETFDCGDDVSYGKTPYQIAKKEGHKEILQLLKSVNE